MPVHERLSWIASACLEQTLFRWSFRNHLPNLPPKLVFAGASLSRKGHNRSAAVCTAKGLHCLLQLVARQPVTFGGNAYVRTCFGRQEFKQLTVALLRSNVRVNQ